MKTTDELKRDLGPWAAAAIVVGTVIGSGIFLVPHDMVLRVGTPQMVFAVWVVGGFLTLTGALSYAELGAAIPEAGGEYAYLREAYGPVWGFLYSWTQMWVAKSGSLATLATGFFLYLTNFFPGLDGVFYRIPLPLGPKGGPLEFRYGQLTAMALILGLGWLNYYGVKLGGEVQVAATAIKVAAIAGIIVAGLLFGSPAANHASAPPVALSVAGFFAALGAALWAYDGWNHVAMVASEVREPQRNLPRALIGGTVVVIVIYLLANAAYFHVLSASDVATAHNGRVAGEMMSRIMGNLGANLVSIAAMISMFAALNGSILAGARVPYAAAREGLFFRSLGTVNPKYHTPGVSILWLAVWACVLVLSGGYNQLLTYVMFASLIVYGMTTAAVVVLRKKRPDLPRPYRTPGYPFTPIAFVVIATAFVISTLWDSPRESLMGLALIVLGLPFYFYWSRKRIST